MNTDLYSNSLPLRRPRRKNINPSLVSVMLVIFISTLICWQLLNSLSLSLACGVAIGLLFFPFAMHRRQNTPVAPTYLTALFLLVAYPIKLIAVRLYVPGVIEEYSRLLFDDDAVTIAMWILSGGILAYYIGYYQTPKFLIRYLEKTRLPVQTTMNQQWYWLALIVTVIGWGSFVFQMLVATWSSFAGLGVSWDPRYNQLLSYLFNYVWCGVIAAAIWLSYQNLKRSWTGIVVCITIILGTLAAVIFLMGSKTWVMSPFLYLCAALYMNERRPPIWLMSSVTVASMVFAFTFVPLYRSIYLASNEGQVGTIAELYQTGNETFSRLDESPVDTSDSLASIINRFGGIDNAVRTMEVVPEPLGYFYFKDLMSVPFSFIPRLIFPWKLDPETPPTYTMEVAQMRSGGSAAPFPVAEGYINLGWVGVVVLFWLWGISQSLLFKAFYWPRRTDALVQILYAFFMVQIVGFGNWITGALLGAPGQIITLIPLILIFRGFGAANFLKRGFRRKPQRLSSINRFESEQA